MSKRCNEDGLENQSHEKEELELMLEIRPSWRSQLLWVDQVACKANRNFASGDPQLCMLPALICMQLEAAQQGFVAHMGLISARNQSWRRNSTGNRLALDKARKKFCTPKHSPLLPEITKAAFVAPIY